MSHTTSASAATAHLLSLLAKVRREGSSWKALCPIHSERTPSLSIRDGDLGVPLVHCFGCGAGYREVVEAVNADMSRFSDDGSRGCVPPAEPPGLDPETLSRANRALLERLTLARQHREAAQARGLTEGAVKRHGFRTLPVPGRADLARELEDRFGSATCLGLPGWCPPGREGHETWPTIHGPAGLVIPCLDTAGRVVALQVRPDYPGEADPDEDRPKYLFISSKKHDGPGPGSPIHVPRFDGNRETAWFTEGYLKAIVTTELSGVLCLGLSGVANQRGLLETARTLGISCLVMAIDMDASRKWNVALAMKKHATTLQAAGYPWGVLRWDETAGKGIDDYLLAAGKAPVPLFGREALQAVDAILAEALKNDPPPPGVRVSLNGAAPDVPPPTDAPPDFEGGLSDPPLEDPDAGIEAPPPPEEPPLQGKGSKRNQATDLVELALQRGADLFHTPEGERFVTVPVGGHHETYPLKSMAAREWLGRLFYVDEGKVAGGQAMQEALNTLGGIARFDRPEYPVFTRLAKHQGATYLFLADAEWRAVRITAEGWTVLPRYPVRFRKIDGMLPLPEPVRGGHVEELRRFLNVASEDDFRLAIGFLVGALSPDGPYAGIEIKGEQGSAKTTTARVLQRLIDPNAADVRVEPKEPRDLAIAAKNAWVIAYDNLSNIHPWLSDALCRLSTGGGLGTRRLFTDDEESLFNAMRPVLWTGIGNVAARSDLMDRLLFLDLPAIKKRRSEREFWAEYEAVRPRVLGALLDAVSTALRELPHLQREDLSRMADFELWVSAAEPALEWAPGTFSAVYAANRKDASRQAVESSLIGAPIRLLVDSREQEGLEPWEGTCKELLPILESNAPKTDTERKAWPGSPEALSHALKRVAPNLRAEGIEVEYLPRTTAGRKIRLRALRLVETDDSSYDGLPPTLPNRHTNCHKEPRTETASNDGYDGYDGYDGFLPSPSPAYIPADMREVERENEYRNGAGRAVNTHHLEEVAAKPSQPSNRHQATSTAVWDLARAQHLRPIDVPGWGRVESWHQFTNAASEEQLRAAVEILQAMGGQP